MGLFKKKTVIKAYDKENKKPVIILVAAIFSVKAIDRHNESIAVNNIRKEIIDGR